MAPYSFRGILELYASFCIMLLSFCTIAYSNNIAYIDFQKITEMENKLLLNDVFLQLQSTFVTAGTCKNVEGEIKSFLNSDCMNEDPLQELSMQQRDWIAVFHFLNKDQSSVSNYRNECSSPIERIRRIILFGASAVLVLALNSSVLKEIDTSQPLSRPIILITGAENITQVLAIIWSQVRTYAKITSNASMYGLKVRQTVSSWSSCERSRPGSGVVCSHDDISLSEAEENHVWDLMFPIVISFILVLLVRAKSNNNVEMDTGAENDLNRDAAESLRNLTRYAITLMDVTRYRRLEHCDYSELCAICLDNFQQKDCVRVLTCDHKFHMSCIDTWLLLQPTCPLCKRNVVEEHLKNLGAVDAVAD